MHAYANPARFLSIARPLTPVLLVAGVVLLAVGLWQGLARSPADYLQGDTVRIMYVHVPAAWLGMGGWSAIAVAALVQMIWRHPIAGVAARATVVPGMVFTALCLVTGSIWGRPTWGTWWEWDGRMTTMLILLFLYGALVALLSASDRDGEPPADGHGALPREVAIYAVLGAAILPVINRSVVWWNSLHQGPSITLRGSTIAPEILAPLWWSVAGCSLLFAAIVLMRMRTIIAVVRVEARLRRLAAG